MARTLPEIDTDDLEQTAEIMRATLDANERGRVNVTNGRCTSSISADRDASVEYKPEQDRILVTVNGIVQATVTPDSRVWAVRGLDIADPDDASASSEQFPLADSPFYDRRAETAMDGKGPRGW